MKTKVAMSEKARKVSSIVTLAVAGVIGVGGITVAAADTFAADNTTTQKSTTSTTRPSTSAKTPSASDTPTKTTTTVTTPAAEEPKAEAATTPDTGFFTGDEEFTEADGLVALTGVLAVVLLGYVTIRNRKKLFRHKVGFNRH